MSVTKQCRDLAVGEHTYIECDTLAQAKNVSVRMGTSSRLPGDMKAWSFSCQVLTAVACGGEVIRLNKVTRTK